MGVCDSGSPPAGISWQRFCGSRGFRTFSLFGTAFRTIVPPLSNNYNIIVDRPFQGAVYPEVVDIDLRERALSACLTIFHKGCVRYDLIGMQGYACIRVVGICLYYRHSCHHVSNAYITLRRGTSKVSPTLEKGPPLEPTEIQAATGEEMYVYMHLSSIMAFV